MSTTTSVIVGNPKAQSRTLDAALRLHDSVVGAPPTHVVDLAELGTELIAPTPGRAGELAAAVSALAGSRFAVVASPTYKATFTGLLKLYLEQYAGGDGLKDVVVTPLMLGAAPGHTMAVDVFLKPVLAEIGATLPAPGLYLMDSTYQSDGAIDSYAQRWGPALRSAFGAGT
jgi:FMN reductase